MGDRVNEVVVLETEERVRRVEDEVWELEVDSRAAVVAEYHPHRAKGLRIAIILRQTGLLLGAHQVRSGSRGQIREEAREGH